MTGKSGASEPRPAGEATPGESLVYSSPAVTRNLIEPLLIALMVTALFTGILVVLQVVTPGIPWLSLALLCFLVALEGVYSTYWLNNPRQLSVDRTTYRISEFVALAAIVRLVSLFFFEGGIPGLAGFQSLLNQPLRFLVEPLFLVSLFIIFMTWLQSLETASIFARLNISPFEERSFQAIQSGRQNQWYDQPFYEDRGKLLNRFLSRWLTGAILLTICIALSSVNLRELATVDNPLAIGRLGIRPGLLPALLLYILSGLWLLSQANFSLLNARWLKNGFQKGPRLDRRWRGHSLLLLLLIVVAAAFLPIGSTVAIGQIVAWIVGGVIYLVGLLLFLYSLIVFGVLALLSSLTGSQPVDGTPPAPPPPITDLFPQTPPPPPDETLGLILSSLFWALLVVAVGVATLFYLRERGYRVNAAAPGSLWRALRRRLVDFWRGLFAQAEVVSLAIRRRLPQRRSATPLQKSSPWRFFRIGGLSPREQIRFFYLSAVRRASEKGLARPDSATPLEFAEELKEHWPEAGEDVSGLTDAFLRARYDQREVDPSDLNPARRNWKHVRSAIRKRRQASRRESDA